jgi:hypothetical protein
VDTWVAVKKSSSRADCVASPDEEGGGGSWPSGSGAALIVPTPIAAEGEAGEEGAESACFGVGEAEEEEA